MRRYQCFLCGQVIDVQTERGWRNWVCDHCAGVHDLKRPCSEWPEWARKFCGRFERRERKQELVRIASGVEVVHLSDCQWEELRDSADE
jgi:hypothetical protein